MYSALASGEDGSIWSWLDRNFKVSERNSTVATEVRAGVVAWMTMSYIAVVNPRILAEASAVTPDDPFPFVSIVTATCITALVAGIYLGVVDNGSGGSKDSGLSSGAIAGIVIGVLVGLAIIAVVVYYFQFISTRASTGATVATATPSATAGVSKASPTAPGPQNDIEEATANPML